MRAKRATRAQEEAANPPVMSGPVDPRLEEALAEARAEREGLAMLNKEPAFSYQLVAIHTAPDVLTAIREVREDFRGEDIPTYRAIRDQAVVIDKALDAWRQVRSGEDAQARTQAEDRVVTEVEALEKLDWTSAVWGEYSDDYDPPEGEEEEDFAADPLLVRDAVLTAAAQTVFGHGFPERLPLVAMALDSPMEMEQYLRDLGRRQELAQHARIQESRVGARKRLCEEKRARRERVKAQQEAMSAMHRARRQAPKGDA